MLHSLGYTTDRWLKVASTLSEDTAPPARLVAPKAQAASSEPRAQAKQLEGLPWSQYLASGRPRIELFPLSNTRTDMIAKM